MENKKHTKKALFGSVIALILCCAMLIGTTFAWFTDTESTAINTIQSGNLDIGVYYALQSDVVKGAVPDDAWKRLDENTPVLNKDALWEPGYTEVVYFKTINEGTLALQYELYVDIIKEQQGLNVDGDLFALSDYIQAYARTQTWNVVYPTREAAIAPTGAPDVWHDSLNKAAKYEVNYPDGFGTAPLSLDHWNWLEPNGTEVLYTTLVLWMPTDVGNEANYGETAPSIDLGISVVATQYNWQKEVDSFDNNYDENAEFPKLPAPPVTPVEDEDINISEIEPEEGLISFVDTTINGTVNMDKTVATVTMDRVSGNTKIVMTEPNTIIMEDCKFDSLQVINETGHRDLQIILCNVTVGGVKITEDNKTEFFTDFEPSNIYFY